MAEVDLDSNGQFKNFRPHGLLEFDWQTGQFPNGFPGAGFLWAKEGRRQPFVVAGQTISAFDPKLSERVKRGQVQYEAGLVEECCGLKGSLARLLLLLL